MVGKCNINVILLFFQFNLSEADGTAYWAICGPQALYLAQEHTYSTYRIFKTCSSLR